MKSHDAVPLNRLAQETSPYLHQHRTNPVDWYPWGQEALDRARRENKPILLSIGYSACHWCHVMAHESFENAQTAALMNEHFVNIKVDREERPDLDQIYQNVAQALTRGGGWPLTVFLTPDLRPFFGGTYFPPEDRWGRPGFPRLLNALAQAFRDDRASVDQNATQLQEYLERAESIPQVAAAPIEESALRSAAMEAATSVDPEWGGLQGAPKFPNPMIFEFLWRYSLRSDNSTVRESVLLTLDRMASGGIFDQLGGGFHRYSVDATWSVPHFEKMLYDNALLLKLYSEVVMTGTPWLSAERMELYREVMRETLEYLRREMRTAEGLFYSAQDADTEGEEGKYFVWDPQSLKAHLDPTEVDAFAMRYGVTEAGNFEHAQTVLWRAQSLESVAATLQLDLSVIQERLQSARARLLAARNQRVKPGLDDKILIAWNALAIEAWVWAARAELAEGRNAEAERLLQEAHQSWTSLLEKAARAEGRLWSTIQRGQGRFEAYLDDYAFLARAGLALADAWGDESEARAMQHQVAVWVGRVLQQFGSSETAGFAFTPADHETLPVRPRTVFDQAIPSGTAVTLECLEALQALGVEVQGVDVPRELERQWQALFPLATRQVLGTGALLSAALTAANGSLTVSGPGAQELCVLPGVHRKTTAGAEGQKNYLICRGSECSLPLKDRAAAAHKLHAWWRE